MKDIRWLPIVMAITIIGITVFQVYWLNNTYEREKRTLEIRSNGSFRETIYKMQASKLKLDSLFFDSSSLAKRYARHNSEGHHDHDKGFPVPPSLSRQKMIGLISVLKEKAKDSSMHSSFYLQDNEGKPGHHNKMFSFRNSRLMQFLYDVDSLQDSIRLKDIDVAFAKRLRQQSINVPFTIKRINSDDNDDPSFNEVVIGFSHPVAYRMELGDTFPYLLRKLSIPILLSFFIVGFTILSFVLLFKSLLKQKRLANIKNEFISNITHELKTPIATVSVAIEAMRSFNATMDPQRSKEYLDISANELQRLSLLVDKVLKLSMFEKKEVDLKYELLNMKDLIEEVTSSMRLQFEKHHATVKVCYEGDVTLEGDRLHLVSVIFNMLDNALKYSNDEPQIRVLAKGSANKVSLQIADEGIGIPQEYQDKIFEKFFRVPTGNLHNAKGYGLGLSYVAHVISKHKGNIKVESAQGQGSKFVITLPKFKA